MIMRKKHHRNKKEIRKEEGKNKGNKWKINKIRKRQKAGEEKTVEGQDKQKRNMEVIEKEYGNEEKGRKKII